MSYPAVSKIETWVHDNSIAVVISYTDGSGAVQVLKALDPDYPTPYFRGRHIINFAGMKFLDQPVRLHGHVQNSRRYAKRNLR